LFCGNYIPNTKNFESTYYRHLMKILHNLVKLYRFIEEEEGNFSISEEDIFNITFPDFTDRFAEKIVKAEKNFKILYVVFSNQWNGK
jgi:lipid A disaccharide synthetase